MRTVIYARYSSALQNARSIDDQIAVCRERAEREGWQIVDVFTDYAISGAAGIDEAQRPGLNAMLARVEAGGIDQVLAESTDRIARHLGDSIAIRERLEFAGARLFTLSDGQVDEVTGTFKGLMDSRFRKELGAKIKRGQRGAVKEGRAPAGLAYGYRKANRLDERGELIRGLRAIDPDQAEIVREIFARYAAGESARAIAADLNMRGVPGPRGGGWRASTIVGDRKRRDGILQNRLYVGELVHMRTAKVTHPADRRIRIRPNPESDWIIQSVPELAIIDRQAFEQAQAVRNRYEGQRPEAARRPKRLLSGLVVCGVCGGQITVIGREQWGCSRYRDGRSCSNNRTVMTHKLESRVLGGIREQMLHPDIVAAFVKEYHLERQRKAADLAKARSRLERQLREAEAKLERLVLAIADGADEFVEIREVLAKARAERDALSSELKDVDAIPVVALHPGIAEDYRRQIENLEAALSASGQARNEARGILRSLIDRVEMIPREGFQRGAQLTVTGRLASLIALAAGEPLLPKMYGNGGAGNGDRTRITSLEG